MYTGAADIMITYLPCRREIRRGNLDMLVEKAAAYEATSYKGLFHFVRYIERLKKYDTDFGEAAVDRRGKKHGPHYEHP